MDVAIETKELTVSIQKNGIIRAPNGRLIARLVDDIEFDSDHLEQSPERVSVDAVVSGTQIVTELEILLEECNVCGDLDGGGWKECRCHVQGVNEGIQKAIAIIEEKYH